MKRIRAPVLALAPALSLPSAWLHVLRSVVDRLECDGGIALNLDDDFTRPGLLGKADIIG